MEECSGTPSQRGLAEIYELLGGNLSGAYRHLVHRVLPDHRLRVFHMNGKTDPNRRTLTVTFPTSFVLLPCREPAQSHRVGVLDSKAEFLDLLRELGGITNKVSVGGDKVVA